MKLKEARLHLNLYSKLCQELLLLYTKCYIRISGMKERIIVASRNPVKMNATKSGFLRVFSNKTFAIEGVSVDSGVSGQPMGREDTLKGAINRVNEAKKKEPNADYWVGIEGGLTKIGEEMEAYAWIVIKSKTGNIGKGRTGSFFLPQKVANLINQGIELGEADDIVFKRDNSKQENGAVGILTGNVLTRASFYEEAVILALIPIKDTDLY